MGAAYDSYDYISYWLGRGYEHKSEVAAIKDLLTKIPKVKKVLEIGAGFGRLTGSYSFRAKKVIITDPSSKLLKIARDKFTNKTKFKFIHGSLEVLPQKVRSESVDLILMVRVIHHIQDVDAAFSVIERMLKKGGYLILEYPNKTNLKTILAQFVHGNFTYMLDIFPRDLRSKRSIKKNFLPFFNYHPDTIQKNLEDHNLKVIEKRSVSNLRSIILKKFFAPDTLIAIEKLLQKPLSMLSFGPSIFILARKGA